MMWFDTFQLRVAKSGASLLTRCIRGSFASERNGGETVPQMKTAWVRARRRQDSDTRGLRTAATLGPANRISKIIYYAERTRPSEEAFVYTYMHTLT